MRGVRIPQNLNGEDQFVLGLSVTRLAGFLLGLLAAYTILHLALPAPLQVGGAAVAALTFGSLMVTIVTSAMVSSSTGLKPDLAAGTSVKNIGEKLMTDYVLPLEVMALLLTAALIGAVIGS